MSHFYADIQGARGPASRTGTKASGINSYTRSWNIGARVNLHQRDGRDVMLIAIDGGSGSYNQTTILGIYEHEEIAAVEERAEPDEPTTRYITLVIKHKEE